MCVRVCVCVFNFIYIYIYIYVFYLSIYLSISLSFFLSIWCYIFQLMHTSIYLTFIISTFVSIVWLLSICSYNIQPIWLASGLLFKRYFLGHNSLLTFGWLFFCRLQGRDSRQSNVINAFESAGLLKDSATSTSVWKPKTIPLSSTLSIFHILFSFLCSYLVWTHFLRFASSNIKITLYLRFPFLPPFSLFLLFIYCSFPLFFH